MSAGYEKVEIPVELPCDPPGSPLRERLSAAYEDCGENCFYRAKDERDWQDHDASTALFVISGNQHKRDRVDIPGLRDVLRDAFIEHSNDMRLSGSGRLDYCLEGNPGYGEERAIVALQALWRFGPRVLRQD